MNMNKKALNKLVDILVNFETEKKNLVQVPEDGFVTEFNLDTWASTEQQREATGIAPHACGTTACAAGTAGLHPWFRAQGLKLTTSWTWKRFELRYGDEQGMRACATFFDISFDDACFMFDPADYAPGRRGIKSVVRRIQYVMDGGKQRGRYAGVDGRRTRQ